MFRLWAKLFKENMDCEHASVEFLKYHEYGKGKWEQCGMTYQMERGTISPETVKYFEAVMKEHGVHCIRT